MKCPSCGAETKDAKYCEYCGSELPKRTPNINITNNYYGEVNNSENTDAGKCPKCHGNKVKFQRERVGSYGSSASRKTFLTDTRIGVSNRQTEYRTVGICQNCGYTWDPNVVEEPPKKKSKGCLWWFLMIYIWPIALSVWFYKTDKVKLNKKIKLAIIAVFWLFVITVGSSSEDTETTTPDTTIESTVETETTEEVEEETTLVEQDTEEVVEVHFNEEFINNYLSQGVPAIIEEYNKIVDNGEYDKAHELLYRNRQPDGSVPVLDEQVVTGTALVIDINEYYSDEGTTIAELYLGEYDFNYNNGLIPEKERLLSEHPEEWSKFVTVTSEEYMKVKKGDSVTFEGKIYTISEDSMTIKGTCYKN